MHHHHHRAFYLGVLSVVMIAAGLLALNFPVFIDAFDQFGFQIKCGTGFGTDLTQAATANGGDTYVGQCETALMLRRLWTIPMVALGSILARRPHLRRRHRVGSRIALRRGPGHLI